MRVIGLAVVLNVSLFTVPLAAEAQDRAKVQCTSRIRGLQRRECGFRHEKAGPSGERSSAAAQDVGPAAVTRGTRLSGCRRWFIGDPGLIKGGC